MQLFLQNSDQTVLAGICITVTCQPRVPGEGPSLTAVGVGAVPGGGGRVRAQSLSRAPWETGRARGSSAAPQAVGRELAVNRVQAQRTLGSDSLSDLGKAQTCVESSDCTSVSPKA